MVSALHVILVLSQQAFWMPAAQRALLEAFLPEEAAQPVNASTVRQAHSHLSTLVVAKFVLGFRMYQMVKISRLSATLWEEPHPV
jgi:hypothetical protein